MSCSLQYFRKLSEILVTLHVWVRPNRQKINDNRIVVHVASSGRITSFWTGTEDQTMSNRDLCKLKFWSSIQSDETGTNGDDGDD